MFENIVFDENGFIDGEVIASHLTYCGYTSKSWLRVARNLLVAHKLPYVECEVSRGKEITKDILQKHSVIKYRSNPENGRVVLYLVNKDGISWLCLATRLCFRNEDVAKAMLTFLGLNAEDVFKRLDGVEIIKNRKEALALAIGKKTRADDVEEDDEDDGDGDDGIVDDTVDDTNELLLLDDIPESLPATDPIYVWRKDDVILAASFASFCGLSTAVINRQIRKLSSNNSLTSGLDFFDLDSTKTQAFCTMNDLEFEAKKYRNGVFLLTQTGVNNLSKYLRNEKARAHSNLVSSAAAVVQDIQRKGLNSPWLDPTKITMILNAILQNQNTVMEAHANVIANNERLSIAYEDIAASQRQLVEALNSGKMLVNRDQIASIVKSCVGERMYTGETEVPPHLIVAIRRRQLFFPAISTHVISKFLVARNHPSEMWNKSLEDSEDRFTPTPIYLREGMETRQQEFFSESVYIKTVDSYFLFNHAEVGNYQVARKSSGKSDVNNDLIQKELSHFIQLLTRYNKKISYDARTGVFTQR